jgi:hypothetical protein
MPGMKYLQKLRTSDVISELLHGERVGLGQLSLNYVNASVVVLTQLLPL